jgi:predicted O-linked N-acetylglucosamine transferase (SPINDLY family)
MNDTPNDLSANDAAAHDAQEAIVQCRAAIAIDPNNAAANANLGVALLSLERTAEAIDAFRSALAIDPAMVQAHNNLGNALLAAGDMAAAAAAYRRAIEIEPHYATAHCNLGIVLLKHGTFAQAAAEFRAALHANATLREAHSGLGAALVALGNARGALDVLAYAVALFPDDAQIRYYQGRAFVLLDRHADAYAAFDAALRIDPAFIEAHRSFGETCLRLGRIDAAADCYQNAHARWPADVDFCCGLAGVFEARGELVEAARMLANARQLAPMRVDIHHRLALILQRMNNLPKALASARRARALQPESVPTLAFCFRLQQELCDWADYAELAQALKHGAASGGGELDPFITHAVPGIGPAEQYVAARAFAQKLGHSEEIAKVAAREVKQGDRIRIGYLSGDFYDHPVGRHMVGILDNHNRDQFEVFGYSLRRDGGSAATVRLRAAVEHWRDPASNIAPEADILRDQIDILVNLGGYTKGASSAAVNTRLAPIQVLYLGYGGTTGSNAIDYLLTDRTVSPPDHARYFTETFAYLPSTLFNAAPAALHVTALSRKECGLADDAFVFCCFCNNYKFTPAIFDIWMNLLRAVPDSVLWLRKFNPFVVDNLRREAAARGVSPDRLVFAAAWPRERHLARQACADIFLDTSPYSGASTAADALWAGVPVLTCAGDTYVSRMGASLANAIGLNELVTDNLESYYDTALRLATDRGKLALLRARVAKSRTSSVLFDSVRFTHHLESVYREMFRRYRAGEPISIIDNIDA